MEKPIQFRLREKVLYGILHLSEGQERITRIILMIVGGYQTRVGSHRLYVQLARALCEQGLPVCRFDYEGIGDSQGSFVGFEGAGPSIKATIDYLYETFPDLTDIYVWSLCDGASACAVYASHDSKRVTAMILCNPWVNTEESQAKTILKYYYIRRLLSKEFWQNFFSSRFNFKKSYDSFLGLVQNGYFSNADHRLNGSLPDRVFGGLSLYHRPVHFILSSNDLTALEFKEFLNGQPILRDRITKGMISLQYIEGADHTFSSELYKSKLFEETLKAIRRFDDF